MKHIRTFFAVHENKCVRKISYLKQNVISSLGFDENLQDGLCWFQKIQVIEKIGVDIIKQSIIKSVCEHVQNSSQWSLQVTKYIRL